jgi:hypothetical protein
MYGLLSTLKLLGVVSAELKWEKMGRDKIVNKK